MHVSRPTRIATTGLVLVLCAGALALGPVASAETAGPPLPSSESTTPPEYVIAMRDAYAAKSFHEVQTILSKGWKSVNTEGALVGGGTETDVITELGNRFSFTARLFNDRLYLNADQETLVTIGSLTPFNGGLNAGRWLVVPKSAAIYGELAIGIDVRSGIDQIALAPPVTSGKITTFRGQKVIPMTSNGGVHASSTEGLQPGRFTLYVSTGAHPLPVAEIVQDTIAKVAQTVTLVFSQWNHPVSIVKPSHAVPLP